MKSFALAGWRGTLLGVLLGLLSACGGGGSSDDTPAPGGPQAAVSLSFSGGAATGFDHVWVTVRSVALHTDPDRAWSADDPSWQVLRLDAPVTVDLAGLNNGVVGAFLIGARVPAGSYGQLRVFLADADDELTPSAKQLGLAHNLQVDTTDAGGNTHHRPLEQADVSLGLRVAGPIQVDAEASNEITLQWDLAHGLVRLAGDDGVDRFLVRPDLRPLRLAATAAIVGLMDKRLFCASGVRANDCLYDVVASALLPSADGRTKQVVRSAPVSVNGSYAVFALYPLPENVSVDVVIRGRNMQTMVVRAVPAAPADLLHAVPTQLGGDPNDPQASAPMVPVLRPDGDGHAALAAPMASRGVQLVFAQTLPDEGELPLEINSASVDPFSGRLAQAVALPGGPLRLATYTDQAVLSFADVVPAEGANHFSVLSTGTPYQEGSAFVALAAPAGQETAFVAAEPVAKAGLGSASLSVSLHGGSAAYDAAELVVADVNGVVAVRDVSASLGGTVTLELPAGAQAAALGGTAVYAVSVRAWHRDAPAENPLWARAPAPVDLRDAASASTSVTLP